MKLLILILTISFFADKLFQPKEIRQNKHKDSFLLLAHVLWWAIPMLCLASIMVFKYEQYWPLKFIAVLSVIHLIIEWCCIRMWTNLWYQKRKSAMVFWICAEQFILTMSTILLFLHFKN